MSIPDKSLLENISGEIKKIAVEAGEKILEVYGDEALFEITTKGDKSPLTKADLLSNVTILHGLEKIHPRWPVISEELGMAEYEKRKTFSTFWMVDPLDGTKEFIKRNGEFTVNIALISDGFPVMGVIYVPVLSQLFWAYKEGGAFVEENGRTRTLSANSFRLDQPGLRVVCSRSHINSDTEAYIGTLQNPVTVARGSSLKFMLIAMGEAEVYPRLGPTMEWDTAAAQAILEEAGGCVEEADTGDRLCYNKKSLLNPYFIAMAKMVR